MGNTVYIKEDDKLDIKLLDALAQILYKWKWGFLIMMVGLAISLGIWGYASNHLKTDKITLKQVNMVRDTLSVEKAEHAEYLYSQYISVLCILCL